MITSSGPQPHHASVSNALSTNAYSGIAPWSVQPSFHTLALCRAVVSTLQTWVQFMFTVPYETEVSYAPLQTANTQKVSSMSKVTQLIRAGAQVKTQVCPIQRLCSWPLCIPYQPEVRDSLSLF